MAKQTASLAKQTSTLPEGAPSLKLPAVFAAPVSQFIGRFTSPYICFAHPKRKDEWTKLVTHFKGALDEGEMVFVSKDRIEKMDRAKLGWIIGKQYWVHKAQNGDLIANSWEEKPKPFKEYIFGVVLVYFEDKVVPATLEARTTKCPAFKELNEALLEAVKPEWAEKSAEHKETLVLNQPFLRFYGDVSLADTRMSKESGYAYKPTQCAIKPTTLVEWRLIDAFQKDEEAQKLLNDAASRYEWKLSEIAKKVPAATPAA